MCDVFPLRERELIKEKYMICWNLQIYRYKWQIYLTDVLMILLAGVLKRSDLERLAYLKAIDNRSDLELFPNNPAFLGPHKDLGA